MYFNFLQLKRGRKFHFIGTLKLIIFLKNDNKEMLTVKQKLVKIDLYVMLAYILSIVHVYSSIYLLPSASS